MQGTFYKFAKRKNSTLRPTGGTVIEFVLKAPTDMLNPTIRIAGIRPNQYNYFKIDSYYYYVTGETLYPNNYMELTGVVDAMATLADDIKNTVCFLLRSQSMGSTAIRDSYAPAMSITSEILYQAFKPVDFDTKGCYLVSVVGGLSNSITGTATTYAMSNLTQLNTFLNSEDFLNQIVQYFFDPYSALISCTWVPLLAEDVTSSFGELIIGNVQTGITVPVVSKSHVFGGYSFDVPIDQTCLSSSEYMSMWLWLPFVGVVDLQVDDFRINPNCTVDCSIDASNGNLIYYIFAGESLIATYTGTCGVEMPVGKSTFNKAQAIGGIIAGAAGAAVMGAGAAASIATGAAGAVHSLRSHSMINGGIGSRASNAFLTAEAHIVKYGIPEALGSKSSTVGLPTYRTSRLGDISGFVQTSGASVSSNYSMTLVEEVNNTLDGGAYIE